MGRRWVALVLVLLAATAIGLSRLADIRDALVRLFPSWGDFDAKIMIRNIEARETAREEQTVKLVVEFVEDKTGKSQLNTCRSQLKVGDEYSPDASYRLPETLYGTTQAVVKDRFVISAKDYRPKGGLRLICDKLVTDWQSFFLPNIPSEADNKTITSYLACIGEYQSVCGNTAAFLGCNFDVAGWAKSTHPKECTKVTVNRLSVSDGNSCGYATFRVDCSGGS